MWDILLVSVSQRVGIYKTLRASVMFRSWIYFGGGFRSYLIESTTPIHKKTYENESSSKNFVAFHLKYSILLSVFNQNQNILAKFCKNPKYKVSWNSPPPPYSGGSRGTDWGGEGPATGHFDTNFSWFPCVYKQMLRWFPTFQVATTCFLCSPPDLNLVVTNFMFYLHVE